MTIKEFLASIGITVTPEQEAKISTEFPKAFKPADLYNTDVKKHKDLADSLQAQLTEANKAIDGFKAMDIDGVKKAADEWKQKAEKAEADAKTKLAEIQFGYALDGALAGAKAKNTKAVKALLDTSVIKLDGDKLLGLDDQLTKLKTEAGYLFDTSTAEGNPSAGDKGTGIRLNSGGTHNPQSNPDYDKMSDEEYYATAMKKEK